MTEENPTPVTVLLDAEGRRLLSGAAAVASLTLEELAAQVLAEAASRVVNVRVYAAGVVARGPHADAAHLELPTLGPKGPVGDWLNTYHYDDEHPDYDQEAGRSHRWGVVVRTVDQVAMAQGDRPEAERWVLLTAAEMGDLADFWGPVPFSHRPRE